MSGRNVSVRVHALQSLNKSLFECVDHHVTKMIAGALVARLGERLPPCREWTETVWPGEEF
jgi:hypothetical protein